MSRDGEHKVVALWKHDTRQATWQANSAPFVSFGMRLLNVEAEPALRGMVDYVRGVLDALGIRVGANHVEVKLEERGPVLVEVNARLHGGDGVWLPIAQSCLGYTQVRSNQSLPVTRAAREDSHHERAAPGRSRPLPAGRSRPPSCR